MKRLLLLVPITVILLIAAYLSLVFGGLIFNLAPRSSPPSAHYIPIFPNATQLHQDYTSISNVKSADFQTSASPKTIQNYYKNILLKEGWTIDTVRTPDTPDSLYFSFSTHYQQYDGGITFHTVSFGNAFELVIRRLDNWGTGVHIRLVAYPGM
ncbi:MAG TPA: hypothetical protein VLQ48_07480 [Chloroflexia bacterium]|nr:hypothetical protein [Chloroflexia bacterium]